MSRVRLTRTRRRALAFAVACSALLVSGCASKTRVTVDAPHHRLVVDGEERGVVPEDGLLVEIPRGVGDVPVQIVDAQGAVVVDTALARETVSGWSWLAVVAAVSLSSCASPSCAALACLAVNPALVGAPVVALTSCSTAGVANVLAAPSCATIPVVALAGAAGLSPALLGFLAFTPESVVALHVPTRAERTDATGAPRGRGVVDDDEHDRGRSRAEDGKPEGEERVIDDTPPDDDAEGVFDTEEAERGPDDVPLRY